MERNEGGESWGVPACLGPAGGPVGEPGRDLWETENTKPKVHQDRPTLVIYILFSHQDRRKFLIRTQACHCESWIY